MKINDKPFNPGELRTPVVLTPGIVSTGTGGFLQKDPDLNTAHQVSGIKAKWVNVHGSEAWTANAEGIIEPATVTIRYRIDINDTWFISKDAGVSWFEVVSMDNIREYGGLLEIKVKRMRAG